MIDLCMINLSCQRAFVCANGLLLAGVLQPSWCSGSKYLTNPARVLPIEVSSGCASLVSTASMRYHLLLTHRSSEQATLQHVLHTSLLYLALVACD